MKIALRDDDTCFYTTPEELEEAFTGLENIPISLSVVPFAVLVHAGTYPYGNRSSVGQYADVASNCALVEYIKGGIKNGHFEVLQHGVHHEYYPGIDGNWIPETVHLNRDSLMVAIKNAHEHLEKTFGVEISTFIAPSNAVSSQCADALDKLHLNTNFTLNKHFARHFSRDYLRNYLNSNIFKMFHGSRLCLPQCYKNHAEIASFDFKSGEAMRMQYESCRKHNQSLIIYTHYWELLKSTEKKTQLIDFINKAVRDGAEPVFVSQCF